MNHHEKHRTRTLWLTGVLHGFTHLYQVALLPLYLQIQQDLHLAGVEQATLLLTIMFAAYFIPSYPMGILADKLSRKKILVAGLAINGLGFLLLSLSSNYGWAVLSMIVAGIGGSFYHPAATALIARLFPEARGRALGWVGTGASVGFFLGPIYCGWRSMAAGSWRMPIGEIGVMGIVAAGFFMWLADEERADPATDVPAKTVGASHNASSVAAFKSLFPTTALWLLFLGAAFALSLRDFTGSAMGTSASLYLQNAHGYSSKAAGWALSGAFVASAISNPIFGRLSDRGRMRWAAFLLIMAGVLVSLFPRVPVAWKGWVLLAYGFFFMATYPITEAALMEAVPDAVRGRVFGVFITIGGFVGNLSHWAVGEWVHRLGPRAGIPESYLPLYTSLTVLVWVSMLGLPCLKALRTKENLPSQPLGEAIALEPAATP
jgi:MFS family permease